MSRWTVSVLVALASVLATAPSGAAGRRPATQTKTRAEVNVLRVVARNWKEWRRFGLVNPRTHLLINNTEAVCQGRGRRQSGGRYARFVCVVRPHVHRGRQGLWLSYRALRHGRCRVHFIVYRR